MSSVNTEKDVFSRNTSNPKKGWGLWNIKQENPPDIWDMLTYQAANSIHLSELRYISKSEPKMTQSSNV